MKRFSVLFGLLFLVATFTCGQSQSVNILVMNQYMQPNDTTSVIIQYDGDDHIAYEGLLRIDSTLHVLNIQPGNPSLHLMTRRIPEGLRWGVYVDSFATHGNLVQFDIASDHIAEHTFSGWALANTDTVTHGGAPIFWREPGDANSDFAVNVEDVLYILKYVILGWSKQPYTEVYGDMDGNHHVQVYDAALLHLQLQ